MYDTILNFDFAVLEALDIFRTDFLNPVMLFITSLGDKGVIWIILGVVLAFFKKTRKTGVCVLAALLINYVLVNLTIKPLVGRLRPFELRESIKLILPPPHDYSFPSGHTSASFAAAISVLLHSKKWGISAAMLACIIAFSRLYLYVHFPTDIIGGILFGLLSAFIACRVINRIRYFQS